jgi:hypothetical protein
MSRIAFRRPWDLKKRFWWNWLALNRMLIYSGLDINWDTGKDNAK